MQDGRCVALFRLIGSSRHKESDVFKVNATVPADTAATDYVLAWAIDRVTECEESEGVESVRLLGGRDGAAVSGAK